jgi:gas vesicle protein
MAARAGRSDGGGFLMGILAGTALGAALAMLFAPKAGWEIRRDLANGVADINEMAKDGWKDVTTVTSSAVGKGLEAYDQARGTAKQTAHRSAGGA